MDLSPFLFGLYKFVKLAVYPYTWLCLSTVAVVALTFLPPSPGRRRWMQASAVLSLAIVWLLGSPVTATIAGGLLESWHQPFDRATTARFDAVVVLGAGVEAKGSLRPSDQLSGMTMQRTLCGVDRFAEGRAPRLVLSGGDATIFGDGPKESVEMRRLAVRLGVPEDAILLEDQSRTTYENAIGTKRVLGQGSILLVTSASHMARAVGLFRQQGFTVTPAPCSYRVQDWPDIWSTLDLFDLVPSLGALDKFTNAFVEAVGTLTYWAAGKI